MDSLISALTLSYLLPAAAHIFLFLPIRQWLLRVEYFSGCLIIMIRSIHYFRQVRNIQYENNTKGCAAVTSPLPWHILSYYYFLLFFLMTTMASTSVLATCMSFPVAVLMVRTFHIWIVIQCFINKGFYCFIRISGNSSKKFNTSCR